MEIIPTKDFLGLVYMNRFILVLEFSIEAFYTD